MECTDALERLSAAMDGELAPAEALAARQHVQACASCSRVEASWRSTRALLRSLPVESVSSGFDASLRARLMDRRNPRRAARARTLVLAGLAAVLVLLAVWPGRRSGPARPPTAGPATAGSTHMIALDCGLTGSSVHCRIDAPCADAGQCGRPGPPDAPFARAPAVDAW